MGRKIGMKIKDIESFNTIDALIPVTIHPKKKFIRGYNKSEEIAIGIKEHLQCKLDTNLVYRKTNSKSQTKKTILERWTNVNQAFNLQNTIITYNHIAIVDDVITSGATIEAICKIILKMNPTIKISILSLALTK